MTLPRISVCIMTYNQDRYIHDCIMSVVAQAGSVSLEILVGDDHSSDGTEEIVCALVKQYPNLIRYFRHETRIGWKNYISLIKEACGEYIAHLDGDDYWLPGKLQRQVYLMDKLHDISAVYTNALCIDDNGEFVGIFNKNQPEIIDMDYLLKRGNFLNNSSLLYRSKFKQKIMEWPHAFIDYKIHLYLASHGQLAYLNICGVSYRINSSTSMIIHQGEYVRELYWEAIREVPEELVKPDRKLYASADFLRRIFFRSARIRSLDLLKKWWPIVSNEYKEQKTRLILLTIVRLLAIGYQESLSKVATQLTVSTLRVIYWR